ncbi:probable 3',5'-cyclic phosphodiesterase pde-2 [Folsomia candida]|uniref:probable 3',5'-cyclic phosphodiesterase pde-2 n=1 Tax=Folsomia candida TaxID=158441 RepID=UPI0016055798|nr:probable 3',5'-cyclic phosphodiesterase pde-2 [Folsomia candida]
MMTASDTCDSVKNWDDNIISARHILSEFFDQGDTEKEVGMTPMPMMDRTVAYIPEVEFKFLCAIVVPVYTELAGKFTELQPCVKTLTRCKDYWEFSTVIFDAHPEVENKLDILRWPQMKEDYLKKLGSTDASKVRRLSDETHHKQKLFPSMSRRTFVSKPIINPESEFRRMFGDIHISDEVLAFTVEEEDNEHRSCCVCCIC